MAQDHTAPDAIAFLAADHARAQALFRGFTAADGNPVHHSLVEEACALLKIHATLAAEILYPAARAALGTDRAWILDRGEAEHAEAARMIGELEGLAPDDLGYRVAVDRLAAALARHIDREEREIFARLRASSLDLEALGVRLRRRRDALQRATEIPGQIEPSAEAEGSYEPRLDDAQIRDLGR